MARKRGMEDAPQAKNKAEGGNKKKKGSDDAPAVDEEETVTATTSQSLYDVLGLDRSASQGDIKKAYHRMALKLHPDKNPGDEGAKDKFQSLQKVFSILGQPEKRGQYDKTGDSEDSELSREQFTNLYEYYRGIYKEVTEDDIEAFESDYRGSDEEKKDLRDLYVRYKGDMTMVFEWLMCSRPEDSHRFKVVIDKAIEEGEVKRFKAYSKWANEVAERPSPKFDPLSKRKKKKSKKVDDDVADLGALMLKRGKERSDDLFASLEAKYGGKGKGKKL